MIFQVVKRAKKGPRGGVKGKKMFWNDKKSVLLHFIYLELYIIWWPFMAHMCEMLISPGVFFFIFSKYWFSMLLKGQKGKKGLKWQKNYVHHVPYLRKYMHHMIMIVGTHMWSDDISKNLFSFLKKFEFPCC